jgi:HEAT repeat protein
MTPNTPDPTWTTGELISFALSHPPRDDPPDPHWDTIRLLHGRGTREVFDAATRLLTSDCPVERELGVNIHAQIGYRDDKPFAAETVLLLNELLERESSPDVLYAALIAFGHLHRPECVPAAVRFADHPDPDVRYGVAFGLAGKDGHEAVAALIRLTTDPEEKVRDWATFALGSQTDADTPEIRAALRARLDDPDNITRGEALKGLAVRRDAVVVDALLAELRREDVHEYAIEAADTLADPRLVPALEALQTRWGVNGWVADVIETCRAGHPA